MVGEIWIPVPEFDNSYEVSNLGRVRSKDRMVKSGGGWLKPVQAKIKMPNKSREGYLSVHLYTSSKLKKMYVHRLVAMAFLENPDDLPQVNHKDGNKENNALSNLEWCSASSNCQHAVDEKLYETAKGEQSAHAKLTEIEVLEIRALAKSGVMQKILAKKYGVGSACITKIVQRQRWKHLP